MCTYEEQYYKGIGESVLSINKIDNGYFIVWQGITDRTEAYTDPDFNTRSMTITDMDTNLTIRREGTILEVNGIDRGKKIEKRLGIKSEHWYQLLPASLKSFVLSDRKEQKFSMFDPYNMQVMNMTVEKHESAIIKIFGKEYPAVRLTMRVQGLLSLLWKSEIWCSMDNGIQLKYEGLNVVPKFYNAVITLKEISRSSGSF